MAAPRLLVPVLAAILAAGATACAPAATTSGAPDGTDGGAGSASFVRPTATPFPTGVEYIVHSGDSLTSIARRFGTTPRSVALWNRDRYPSLDPDKPGYAPDRIGVGWRLIVIPNVTYEEAVDASASTASGPSIPSASIEVPPGPTPRTDGVAVFVAHAGPTVPAVALTFELRAPPTGSDPPSARVLGILASRQAAATVFVSAAILTGDPGGALPGRPPVLMGVGGWTNADGSGVPTQALLASAVSGAKAAGLGDVRPWYRPGTDSPEGPELRAAGRAGLAFAVGWDVDGTGAASASDLAARVLSRIGRGSIVRLDLGDPTVADALPEILDGLADRGLVPLTVAGLLGRGS